MGTHQNGAVNRLVVLRGGSIGDLIVTLPALEALRRHWPLAHVELVARTALGPLVAESGLASAVRCLDGADFGGLFGVGSPVPAGLAGYMGGFDLAVSFLHDPDGYVRRNLEACGVRRVIAGSPIVGAQHASDHFLGILDEAGVPVRYGEAARITLAAERRERGRRRLEGIGRRVVVLHPGSGSSLKNWPLDRYMALARRLRESGAAEPLFSIGEAEGDMAVRLAATPDGFAVAAGLTLAEVAEMLSAASACVGNDSGITHLAAALGVPVVAVFGPTDARTWGPRGPRVCHVVAEARSAEALRAVEVERVWSALESRMQKT